MPETMLHIPNTTGTAMSAARRPVRTTTPKIKSRQSLDEHPMPRIYIFTNSLIYKTLYQSDQNQTDPPIGNASERNDNPAFATENTPSTVSKIPAITVMIFTYDTSLS